MELAALPPGSGLLGEDVAAAWRGRVARRRGAGGRVLGRFRLRAVPLPGLPGAGRGDGLLLSGAAVPRRHAAPVHPAEAGRGQAARARAGGDRADRAGRVLPDLLGHHAVLPRARDPGPGSRLGRRLDRGLRAGDHARRPDPAQAAVRALHQRGPHLVPGRGHRLRLVAPRGSDPVLLRALRRRAHGDGLQPRHVPGAVGGQGGRLRAGVSAATGRSRGQGARDVRLGHGPPRPRGRGRFRRLLHAVARRGRIRFRRRVRRAGRASAASSTGWASSTMAAASCRWRRSRSRGWGDAAARTTRAVPATRRSACAGSGPEMVRVASSPTARPIPALQRPPRRVDSDPSA